VSELSSVRAALHELAEPRPVGDFVKQAIARAARLAGLSYTRCFDLWYGKARRIEEDEQERIAEAVMKKRSVEAKNEIHALRLTIERHEILIRRALQDIDRIGLAHDRAKSGDSH
jgi:hypothetical protein